MMNQASIIIIIYYHPKQTQLNHQEFQIINYDMMSFIELKEL